MIAQDTGSAIVGPARADLYFGAGDEAGQVAGRIRQPGRFAMLLPRELDPAAAGARMPLPPVKPAPAAVAVPPLPPAKAPAAERPPPALPRLAAPPIGRARGAAAVRGATGDEREEIRSGA